MNICGVIAEFDPLHKGHIYLLRQIRKKFDGVVVIISGHATQRGELSRFDKWSRAKAALLYGADLVIELPVVYSCSSAEYFASSSIYILSKLNIVKSVCFGSESGDIKKLYNIALKSLNIEKTDDFKSLLKQGYNHPTARNILLKNNGLELNLPNNILGIEYIKASLKQNVNLDFHTIKRVGNYHNNYSGDYKNKEFDSFKSSSFLRNNFELIYKYLPNDILHLFKIPSILNEDVFLYKLKSMNKSDFLKLPDVNEGLENRLYMAAKSCCSLDNFIELVKTKRYTYTRIKRIVLYSLLDLNKSVIPPCPQYCRVLGFNYNGQRILNNIKRNSSLFISPSFKDIYKNFYDVAIYDALATDLFYLGTKNNRKYNMDFYNKAILPCDLL